MVDTPAVAAAGPLSTTHPMPTYFSSAASGNYVSAKALLSDGKFEEALTLIEEGSENTKLIVRSQLALTIIDNEELERSIELHESIAPFFYLYGTTLLYSLEEATEDGNDVAAMTVAPTTTTTAPTTVGKIQEHQEKSVVRSAAPEKKNDDILAQLLSSISSQDQDVSATAAATKLDMQQQQLANSNDADFAEDIQIAWENLDTARSIIKTMIENQNSLSGIDTAKLELDLAQIHLREGDLNKINGNYCSAIEDYLSCLEILLSHNKTKDENSEVRNLDRKIADTQFNLGLTYLTSSSDLSKKLAGESSVEENPTTTTTTVTDNKNTVILAREHCEKGIHQYVECVKTFCCILSVLIGVKPETILSKASKMKDSGEMETRAPGLKTTGLDGHENGSCTSTSAAVASRTISNLRKAVALTLSSDPPTGTTEHEKINDIKELLDEIQETVDEAERSQEGVRQAAQIKVNAQKQVAALSDADNGNGFASVTNEDTGITTSVGFGPPSSSSFEAAIISNTDIAAKPMMVVKKKKRKDDIGKVSDASTDTKRIKIS